MRGILVDRGLVYYRVYYKGQQIQKCFGRSNFGNSFRSAVRALKQLRREHKIKRLQEKPTRRVTVANANETFIRRFIKEPKNEPYRKLVKAYLAPVSQYFGERFLDTLTPEDIFKYRQARDGQVSLATINSEHRQFRQAIAYLLKWSLAGEIPPISLTQQNPAEVVKIPWLKDNQKGKRIPLEKLNLLISSAPSPLKEIILDAIETGETRDTLLAKYGYPFGKFRLDWPTALQKASIVNKDFHFTYLKRLKDLLPCVTPPLTNEPGNDPTPYP